MMTIEIRVFKGADITLNEDGSYKNENWTVALSEYGFTKYLKYIKAQGFCKVELESVFEMKSKDGGFQKIDVLNEIKEKYRAELKQAFNPEVKKELSLEELTERLAKLEDENKSLRGNNIQKPDTEQKDIPVILMNKAQLIDFGASIGLELDPNNKRNDLIQAIQRKQKEDEDKK